MLQPKQSAAVYTVTNHNPSIQSFDRVLSPSVRALVARADGGKWRFFVTSDRLSLAVVTTPAAAAFGDLGSFGGFPAPFCNHCRLYVDALQTRIRATAPNGLVILNAGPQPVDERMYIDLDTPQGYKFEIRESTAGAGINYAVIWYRG